MPSVQRVRWARFRVTITGLVALAILAVVVVLLTGGTLFQPQAFLYLYIPDGTGLGPGIPVGVDGIQVGKVDTVTLSGLSEPHRVVKVTMKVRRDLLQSITEDSTAEPTSPPI